MHPEIDQEKIDKELSLVRVAGPFQFPPIPTLIVTPIGLVEKKNKDFRLIHHLSYHKNDYVNDNIDPNICYVQYPSFDQAISLVQKLGKGCLLGKSDIKSAFRLLLILPSDFDQLN